MFVVVIVLGLSAPALADDRGDTFSFAVHVKGSCGSLGISLEYTRRSACCTLAYDFEASSKLGEVGKEVRFASSEDKYKFVMSGGCETSCGGRRYDISGYGATNKPLVTDLTFKWWKGK